MLIVPAERDEQSLRAYGKQIGWSGKPAVAEREIVRAIVAAQRRFLLGDSQLLPRHASSATCHAQQVQGCGAQALVIADGFRGRQDVLPAPGVEISYTRSAARIALRGCALVL